MLHLLRIFMILHPEIRYPKTLHFPSLLNRQVLPFTQNVFVKCNQLVTLLVQKRLKLAMSVWGGPVRQHARIQDCGEVDSFSVSIHTSSESDIVLQINLLRDHVGAVSSLAGKVETHSIVIFE
jgi:hypothetical protein